MERVAVIGASSKPDRYAYKAVHQLLNHGHAPLPVSLRDEVILDQKCYRTIDEVPQPIDTVTLYVNPRILTEMVDGIIAKKPKRVIMNPGTESEEHTKKFESAGIRVIRACTLVLLSTGQFDTV
jgi:predicted CoA-binding protein